MNTKLKRYTYSSNSAKVKHFFSGLFGWGVFGGALVFLLELFIGLSTFTSWLVVLIFMSLLAYFFVTKYWVAVGLITNILINLLFWGLDGFIISGYGDWLILMFPFPFSILIYLMQ